MHQKSFFGRTHWGDYSALLYYRGRFTAGEGRRRREKRRGGEGRERRGGKVAPHHKD